MDKFFKELVERAQYYEQFEFFRYKCKKGSDEIEQEPVGLEGKKQLLSSA